MTDGETKSAGAAVQPAVGAADSRVPAAGIALVVLLAFLWGLNWPAIRVSVQEISPWTFRAICLTVATLVLVGMSLVRRARLTFTRRELGPLILVALLNVTAWHLLTAFGLTVMEASRGILLAFSFPVWSVLLGRVLLRERLTPGRLAGLALGVAAMALLMGPELMRVGGTPLGGTLLIGAAVVWALATMLVKRFTWTIGSLEFAWWQLAFGGIPIVIGALLLDAPTDFGALSTKAWVGLIYASTIASALGQWVWFQILRLMPAAVASISTLAIPVVGVFSGGLLLGESVTWRELTALALVLSALAVVMVGGHGLAAIRRMLGR